MSCSTRIVAHRGACLHAPENTVASALTAARLGADIIELDVRQSLDGVLYVLHDSSVDRTTNGTGLIANMESSELDRLDAGSWYSKKFSRESVPRLDVFLRSLPRSIGFYIEVKSADADSVAATIRDCGVQERCFTYSESADMRAAMSEAAPWLKRMLNIRDIDADVNRLDAIREWGAQIVEYHAEDFDFEQLELARGASLETMIYTSELKEALFQDLLAAGIDYLNNDYPEVANRLRSNLP